jgi:hypothetical protein
MNTISVVSQLPPISTRGSVNYFTEKIFEMWVELPPLLLLL